MPIRHRKPACTAGPSHRFPRIPAPLGALGLLLNLTLDACLVPRPACAGPPNPIAPSAFSDSLKDVRRLLDEGTYGDAEAKARRLLAGIAFADSSDSLRAARVMVLLAGSMRKGGKAGSPETAELAERALRINDRILGREHAQTATSLLELASIHHDRDEYERARTEAEEGLAIEKRTLGPEHEDLWRAYNLLGNIYSGLGKGPDAKRAYEQAI